MTDPSPPRLTESGDPAMSRLLSSAKAGGELTRVGARERVWRSVLGAPAPSRAKWLIPAVALGAAAFLVLRPELPAAPAVSGPFATLALASGDVQATHSGGTWASAQVGEALPEGSQLRTVGRSRAYTRFSAAGGLFGDGTRASLSRTGAGVEVQLDEGTATLSVREELVVRADAYRFEVTHAVFQVRVGAEQLDVFVHEGTLRVRGPSTQLELQAGESWSKRTGRGQGKLAAAELSLLLQLAAASSAEATLHIPRPAGADIFVDGVELGVAPLSALRPVGTHQVVAVQHGVRVSTQTVLGREGTTVELAELPALAPAAEKPLALQPGEVDAAAPLQQKLKGPLSEADRDAASYDLARLLSRRGRHTEALALYERLAAGNGTWAESALYEVGRLKLRYLEDPSGAVAAFVDYRGRYPKGALTPEVALSSIEGQLARGEATAALREMDAFLLAFASSERVDDVRFVRASVRRDHGDCPGALSDYLLLVRSPRHADDALYFAAYCEQQGQDSVAARRHLGEYLLRFPAGKHLAEARAALGR